MDHHEQSLTLCLLALLLFLLLLLGLPPKETAEETPSLLLTRRRLLPNHFLPRFDHLDKEELSVNVDSGLSMDIPDYSRHGYLHLGLLASQRDVEDIQNFLQILEEADSRNQVRLRSLLPNCDR